MTAFLEREEWQQFSLAGVTTVVEKPLLSHDLKFSLRHLNDFSRCAIVSDAKFLSLVSTIAEPFIDCQVAYFKLNEVDRRATGCFGLKAPPMPSKHHRVVRHVRHLRSFP